MARQYRALISVPISADDDEQALQIGTQHAYSLMHPGSAVVAGHLEFLGELRGDVEIARIVWADPDFESQLGADWKP